MAGLKKWSRSKKMRSRFNRLTVTHLFQVGLSELDICTQRFLRIGYAT